MINSVGMNINNNSSFIDNHSSHSNFTNQSSKTNSMIRKRHRNEFLSENTNTANASITNLNNNSLIKPNSNRLKRSDKLSKFPFFLDPKGIVVSSNNIGSISNNQNFPHYTKFFSLLSNETCFCGKIGQKSVQTQIENCAVCFRSFHSLCLKEIFKNSEDTEKENNSSLNSIIPCGFCDYKDKKKCVLCSNKIEAENDIQIQCELCGVFMHYECLKIPISLIFSRNFYMRHFKSDSEKNFFEEKLKELEAGVGTSQITKFNKKMIVNFLEQNLPKNRESNNLINYFLCLFTICKFCIQSLNVENEVNFFQGAVYKQMGFKKINFNQLNPIHEIFSINTLTSGENLNNKNYRCSEKLQIKEIVDFFALNTQYQHFEENSFSGYFLVKWRNIKNKNNLSSSVAEHDSINSHEDNYSSFSFENNIFLSKFENLDWLKEKFLNEKLKREIKFYEDFFEIIEKTSGENLNFLFTSELNKFYSEIFYEKINELKAIFQSLLDDQDDSLPLIVIEDINMRPKNHGTNPAKNKQDKNQSPNSMDISDPYMENLNIFKVFLKIIGKLEKFSLGQDQPDSTIQVENPLLNNFNLFLSGTFDNPRLLEELRINFLFPIISSFFSYPNQQPSTKSLYNPKIIICYDDISILKKWKQILKCSTLSYHHLKYKSQYSSLLYEMFYYNLHKINKSLLRNEPLNKYLKHYLNSKNDPDEFFKLLENNMMDFNHTKFDVLLVERKAYLFSYFNIFQKMDFNLILLDVTQSDTFVLLKELIMMESRKIGNITGGNRMIIMKSGNSNSINSSPEKFDMNFSNFLNLFYSTEDWLIDLPTNEDISKNLKILSKDKKYFPKDFKKMTHHLKSEYNFDVLNLDSDNLFKKNTQTSSQSHNYFFTSRKDNFMETDLNSIKSLINFIPVYPSRIDFLQYICILKERKKLVLDKKHENKSDLIKNLSTFCSFPALMVKYYLNQLESIKLKLSEESSINKNKLNTLINLIRTILKGDDSSMSVQPPSQDITINIIYSDHSSDDTRFNVLKNFKQIILKDFEKEKIKFFSTSNDDVEDLLDDFSRQKFSIFIFFNVFITAKSIGKLFRGIFNSVRNKNLFIYHLYLENTVEQNLVCEFYNSLEDIIYKDITLLQCLDKEAKENVLKKSLLNFRFFNTNGFNELMSSKKVIMPKDSKQMSREDFDGVFIIDKISKIFTKNSEFFINKNNTIEEASWDFILDEHFNISQDQEGNWGNGMNFENSFSGSISANNPSSIMTRNKRNFHTLYGSESANNFNPPVIKTNMNEYDEEDEENTSNVNDFIPLKRQKIINDEKPNDHKSRRGMLDRLDEDVEMHGSSNTNNFSDKNLHHSNSHSNEAFCNSKEKDKFSDNIEIIILEDTDDDLSQGLSKSHLNSKKNNVNSINQENKNKPESKTNDKNLIQSLVSNKKNSNGSKAHGMCTGGTGTSSNEENSDLERLSSNSNVSNNKKRGGRKKITTSDSASASVVASEHTGTNHHSQNLNSIQNSNSMHHSFTNLRIVNSSNNLFILNQRDQMDSQNDDKDKQTFPMTGSKSSITLNIDELPSISPSIESLLTFIEQGNPNFIGHDLYCEVNVRLIKLGMTLPVRMTVQNFIYKFGVDGENFPEYTNHVLGQLERLGHKNFSIESLRFYIEYFLTVLEGTGSGGINNLTNNFSSRNVFPQFCLSFILPGNFSAYDIQKSILLMNKIREFLSILQDTETPSAMKKAETMKMDFKCVLIDIISSLPDKFNTNVNSILNNHILLVFMLNFAINILKSVPIHGFNDFKRILNSPILRENLHESGRSIQLEDYKSLLYKIFKGEKRKPGDDVDDFLISIVKVFYLGMVSGYLDKFEI